MKRLHKIKVLFALALCLCLTLAGCGGGPKQEAAASAEEATVHFLTNLQNGEFDQAKTYLDEGNPLLTVFPVAEGETAPELDAVYRQFREKMTGLTFRVGDEGAVGNSMVYITAAQYDFRSAINEQTTPDGCARALPTRRWARRALSGPWRRIKTEAISSTTGATQIMIL